MNTFYDKTLKKQLYYFKNYEFVINYLFNLLKLNQPNLPPDVKIINYKLKKGELVLLNSENHLFEFIELITLMHKTPNWSKKWINALRDLGSKYQIEIEYFTLEEEALIKTQWIPTFHEYLCQRLHLIKKFLDLKHPGLDFESILDEKTCLDDLNFDRKIDNMYSKKESFFLLLDSKEYLLNPHLTPIFVKSKAENVVDYSKVFRRQTVDKTHLCEFYQLEFHKTIGKGNPLSHLKKTLLKIFYILGLDLSKIEFRSTRYHYTSPSIEVFYQLKNGSSCEIAGGGVMDPFVIKKNKCVIAAGIGLQRIYGLVYRIDSLNRIHNIIN